ncbi:MAG: zeta toxin family protein [Candidatus Accumulibacter sp.]|jgi:predicted ABC-type ATPase|nr:zeta toxin family protein [Accumulibacter sp.]
MSSYKPLSQETVREITTEYFAERKDKGHAQVEPVLVLVGGQPGAGKTAAGHMARAELARRGGYVHVDADRMRRKIDTGGTRPSSEETQADAGRLSTELRRIAVLEKRNIIEEGTLRNAEVAGAFLDAMKKEGYKAELLAVATPREESLVGIYQRYEKQHAQGTENPRFVTERYHDEAMQGFEKTLAQNESKLDRVRVIDRNGQVLYDSADTGKRHASALQALQEGQKLTDRKLYDIDQSWSFIKEAAARRSADRDYLATIEGHQERIADMQNPQRLGEIKNPQ